MKELHNLLRNNIKELSPYSTARDDCKQKMEVYLDANENPYDNGVNRYPSPFQKEVKQLICALKGINIKNIFLGNGSDEPIDLVYRIFCEPGKSSAVVVSPSYGMYGVAAKINDVKIIETYLDENFKLSAEKVLGSIGEDTKLIFICSPNNPSGNALDRNEIERIIAGFDGIVIVDEAYIDFAEGPGLAEYIGRYPNLIVLQTLSKAWGMAGLRMGIAIAHEFVINIMNKVKYPYNISVLNQQKAMEMLRDVLPAMEKIKIIKQQRGILAAELGKLECTEKVFPSDANFLLVKFKDKDWAFRRLQENGIIVRDRSSLPGCGGCLRITVGTESENSRVIDALCNNGNWKCRNENGCMISVCNTLGNNERKAKCCRHTKETSIQVGVNLDRFEAPVVSTGLRFLDHMLEQIGYHGGITLNIICSGDIDVDDHHTVEDIAIALGCALLEALGNKSGIERYGFALPMDEAGAVVLLDLGGRIDFCWEVAFSAEMIGDVNSQMFRHFFKSLSENLKCNLHIKASGKNDHHIIEGVFKAFARALKCAVRKDERNFSVASSKGVL